MFVSVHYRLLAGQPEIFWRGHYLPMKKWRTCYHCPGRMSSVSVSVLTLVAILCGAEGCKDIQRFGESKLEWLRKYRVFKQGIPWRHTIARIIGSLSPDNRLDCFVSWLNSVREKQGHEHLVIDGKTLRRSHHNGDKMTALQLLSVMAVDSGPVVYQSRSADKKNEIKSVQESLELFDVKDSCVTLDAMHCQKETVSTLRKQQADYVIQVKNRRHRKKHTDTG